MKEYPSISRQIDRSLQIYAFDKLDGSNIRVEWSRKAGFYKYGSRTCLMDANHPELGQAVGLIESKYAQVLSDLFCKERWDHVVAFFEFFGTSSFAGQHKKDESHDVVLIDVAENKKGIMPPNDFVRTFGHLHIPAVVHIGRAGVEFEQSVRDGTLPGMTFEGVVCKGVRKGRHLTMFKIKSEAWINRLREFCKGDDRLFQKLL